MKTLLITLLLTGFLMGQEVVELKQSNSAKTVVKLMFNNGSISDPSGKEGLTYTTVQLITQGGTGDLSYSDIQEMIYPIAARYG